MVKIYLIILDITIINLVKRIECKSDIVITTIINISRNCCNRIFDHFEKDDIKIKGEFEDDNVHIQILMEKYMYSRKIGKYVEDQQRKILDDLSVLIRFTLEKINWEEILKKTMRCIYDRNTVCQINPDGPMTKDFVCLKCHKPGKESKNENIKTQANNRRVFNARGKIPPKRRGLGRGRGRGRR